MGGTLKGLGSDNCFQFTVRFGESLPFESALFRCHLPTLLHRVVDLIFSCFLINTHLWDRQPRPRLTLLLWADTFSASIPLGPQQQL